MRGLESCRLEHRLPDKDVVGEAAQATPQPQHHAGQFPSQQIPGRRTADITVVGPEIEFLAALPQSPLGRCVPASHVPRSATIRRQNPGRCSVPRSRNGLAAPAVSGSTAPAKCRDSAGSGPPGQTAHSAGRWQSGWPDVTCLHRKPPREPERKPLPPAHQQVAFPRADLFAFCRRNLDVGFGRRYPLEVFQPLFHVTQVQQLSRPDRQGVPQGGPARSLRCGPYGPYPARNHRQLQLTGLEVLRLGQYPRGNEAPLDDGILDAPHDRVDTPLAPRQRPMATSGCPASWLAAASAHWNCPESCPCKVMTCTGKQGDSSCRRSGAGKAGTGRRTSGAVSCCCRRMRFRSCWRSHSCVAGSAASTGAATRHNRPAVHQGRARQGKGNNGTAGFIGLILQDR